MSNRVAYEWTAEQIDENGDVQDVDFRDSLSEKFIKQAPADGCVRVDVGLSKKIWNEVEGELERHYWYPPSSDSESGFEPPKKYLAEAAKFGLI